MTALKLLMAETQSKASWPEVIAENERLRSQVAEAQADVHRFQAALSEALAEKARLEAQLTEAQAIIACLQAENNRLHQELREVQQAPFKSRRRRQPKGEKSATPKRRGRAKGHPGSGRKRPSRIDRTERILAERREQCPGLAYRLVPGSTWEVTTAMAEDTSYETLPVLKLDRPLSVLKFEHIRQIDDALAELGPFGEVRIIKQRGKH